MNNVLQKIAAVVMNDTEQKGGDSDINALPGPNSKKIKNIRDFMLLDSQDPSFGITNTRPIKMRDGRYARFDSYIPAKGDNGVTNRMNIISTYRKPWYALGKGPSLRDVIRMRGKGEGDVRYAPSNITYVIRPNDAASMENMSAEEKMKYIKDHVGDRPIMGHIDMVRKPLLFGKNRFRSLVNNVNPRYLISPSDDMATRAIAYSIASSVNSANKAQT